MMGGYCPVTPSDQGYIPVLVVDRQNKNKKTFRIDMAVSLDREYADGKDS